MPAIDVPTDRPFTVMLPPDLDAALREAAKAHDHSRAAAVRQALRTHLAAIEPKRPIGSVEGS